MAVKKNVILFSNECPRCKVLKKKLQNCEIYYSENNDPDKIKEMGLTSFPMLKVNEKMLDFCEAVKWINNLGACNEYRT